MTKDFEPIKDLTPTERYIPNGPSLLSFGIKKTLLYVTGGENGGFQQLYAYDDEGKSIHHNGFSVNFGPIVQGGVISHLFIEHLMIYGR